MSKMHPFWQGTPSKGVTVKPVVKTNSKVYACKVRRTKGGDASR